MSAIDEAEDYLEKYTGMSYKADDVIVGLLKEIEKRDKMIEAAEIWSKNWGLRQHTKGEIVVSNKDGSGVLLRDNDDTSIAESLFYRMMDEILAGG